MKNVFATITINKFGILNCTINLDYKQLSMQIVKKKTLASFSVSPPRNDGKVTHRRKVASFGERREKKRVNISLFRVESYL